MPLNALLRRLPGAWTIALVLVCGSILHICWTFVAPLLVTDTAFRRLARNLPLNTMQVLPPVTASAQALPFMLPDMRYALCRYDTESGPVTLRATLPEPGWLMTLHSPDGDNFYSVPAPRDRRASAEVALLVTPTGDRFLGLSATALGTADSSQANLPSVSSRSGLVVIRAPVKSLAHAAQVEADLRKASCQARAL